VALPAPPTGYSISQASVTTLTPKFTLSGTAIGSVHLDNSQFPIFLSGTTYRFFIDGTFATTGTVVLNFLPGSWSLQPSNYTVPSNQATQTVTLDQPGYVTVPFPDPPTGYAIDPNSIINAPIDPTNDNNQADGSSQFGLTLAPATGTPTWTITLVPGQTPFQAANPDPTGSSNLYRFQYQVSDYVDVTLPAPPSGFTINQASVTSTLAPFNLSGAGLGTVTLDTTKAPIHQTGNNTASSTPARSPPPAA